jgi:hypothetical protein
MPNCSPEKYSRSILLRALKLRAVEKGLIEGTAEYRAYVWGSYRTLFKRPKKPGVKLVQ